MRGRVRRRLALLLLILGLAPGTWLRVPKRPWNPTVALRLTPVPLPPRASLASYLGPFALDGVWSLTSPYGAFGGYSALVPLPDGRLMAISDSARRLTFSPPGVPPLPPRTGDVIARSTRSKFDSDVEAAARDPVTGTIWTAREYINAISRHDPGFRRAVTRRPAAIRDWSENSGPEAMARLADGRFIALAEGFTGWFEWRRHEGVLFAGDPVADAPATRFEFSGAPGLSPTDMTALPDGRVLILMRRLVWPFPLRFAGAIMLADPAAIRRGETWNAVEIARLEPPLPADNFEGMAVVPRADGTVIVWLISDNNGAATQRTLLWKLALDPARLPRTRERARRPAPRPLET
jgi:hypothetical protein